MAAFDFPSSPSVNQTYTANGVTWKWNGTMWMRVSGAGYLEKIEEGNSKIEVDDSGSGNITATTDGTERLRIDSVGRLLLGTTTEGSAEADTFTIAESGSAGMTIRSGTAARGSIFFSDGTSGAEEYDGQIQYDQSERWMRFATAQTERLRIHSNGNVQVRTNNAQLYGAGTLLVNSGSSSGRLDVYGGSTNRGGEINLYGGSNSDGIIQFRSGAGANQQPERMRIDSSGRLLLGTTTPGHAIADNLTISDSGNCGITLISGTSNYGALYFGDSGGNNRGQVEYNHSADSLHFYTAASERIRITNAGLVGINDTSPDANLSVAGSTAFIDVGAAGGNRAKIGYSSNNCIFGVSATAGEFLFKNNVNSNENPVTAGTTRMRITGSGHVLRPTMAAVAVTLSADQNTLTTFNTSYQTLSLNSEGYDNANNFNTSNYRFTAPETGFYQVGCNVQLENGSRSASGNRWMYIYPLINGATQASTSNGNNEADFDPADTYYYNWTYTTLLKLSQNDYVEWKYRGNLDSVNLRGQRQSVFYFYQVG